MTGKDAIKLIVSIGVSQAEAARLLGISPTAVQKWKSGGDLQGSTETLLRMLSERPELADVIRRTFPSRWK